MRIFDGMRYYKKTETQNNMPRVRVTLKETVDHECLQSAAERTLERIRLFRMVVISDEKRFYLEENHEKPVVHLENGAQHRVCTSENHGHMLWISHDEYDIYVDFFHGISDGKGILRFIQTLLYFYCEKKYGTVDRFEIPGLIHTDVPEMPEEYRESILFLQTDSPCKDYANNVSERKTAPERAYCYEKAFQFPEEQMESDAESQYYELKVDAKALTEYIRGKDTSPAAVFALFMNRAIFVHCSEKETKISEPIVGAMAVDARKAYGAEQTLQCCVATIPMWYDENVAIMSLEEQLVCSKDMIRQGIQPGNIAAGAFRTKKFNEMLEEKFPTLEEKRQYCQMAAQKGLDRYTYGISCVGKVSFGKGIDEHVTGAAVILCANTSPVILEITKFGDTYYISYCTHLKQDPYVQKLQEIFLAEGIDCTCEKKENFVETRIMTF